MEELYNKVSEILKISVEEAQRNCKKLDEINAYYFWNSGRGGNAVIINESGEKLGATSSVSFEEHLDAFKKGVRN